MDEWIRYEMSWSDSITLLVFNWFKSVVFFPKVNTIAVLVLSHWNGQMNSKTSEYTHTYLFQSLYIDVQYIWNLKYIYFTWYAVMILIRRVLITRLWLFFLVWNLNTQNNNLIAIGCLISNLIIKLNVCLCIWYIKLLLETYNFPYNTYNNWVEFSFH